MQSTSTAQFGDMLSNALNTVHELQQDTGQKRKAVETCGQKHRPLSMSLIIKTDGTTSDWEKVEIVWIWLLH